MPQMWLPIFPKGLTYINNILAYAHERENVTYYNGMMPIFTHHKDDVQSFRLILSQFYVNGNAKQSELVRAFGIPPVTLKRAVKTYRKDGPKGFFEPKKSGGPRVLTPDVVQDIERQLDDGRDIEDIADQLGIKKGTILKGMQQGRIKKKPKSNRILHH
jgi:transposase-like protein